ncbi:MAG: hypothetical protein HY748_00300 [Elusimicrobia bacterium]|nr:hypothetical protein [Elusimicrobiota bacterium]
MRYLFLVPLLSAAVASAQVFPEFQSPDLPELSAFRKAVAGRPAPATDMVAAAATAAEAQSSSAQIPSQFSIYERFFTIFVEKFDLKDPSGKAFGLIEGKFFRLTKTFEYLDGQGDRVAQARARFFALGSTVDVTDPQGRVIGTIKENILKSLFKVYTSYNILDGQGRMAAESEKVEWLSTEMVLRQPDGRVVAEVRRGFKENLLRFTDRWDVTIRDPKAVDPRLIVMIGVFKSSVDNDRRKKASEDSGKRSSSDE